MRPTFPAVLTAALLAAAPALAWSDGLTQPAGSPIPVYAYPAKANYCPAGLQPVILGGVICCGVATHAGYRQHPARPRAASPAYVSYGKGAGDTHIVYEKGQ